MDGPSIAVFSVLMDEDGDEEEGEEEEGEEDVTTPESLSPPVQKG